MYKAFFNLTRYPFDLTPDPTCFVASKRHNEALAALYYGVRRHKGFVVVTGEVGTGKTLLLRCLLDDKLLQIILAGQPELDQQLDSVELRQLKQRIAVRTQLYPLDADETRRYIEQRLQIAGADFRHQHIFSEQAISAVFRHSRGLPRLINTICENALITAYAKQLPTVTSDIIEDLSKEFRFDIPWVLPQEASLRNDSHGEGKLQAARIWERR